ncbi:MAG: DUF3105 domain-containing protein [Anaerolineae bacterium]|nr:DUF3105 domain-containing protein [Anaerolineae bacterium]
MAKKTRPPSGYKTKNIKQASKTSQVPTWVWFAGGGIALVLLIIGLFYLGEQGPAIANSHIEGLIISPDPGRGHTEEDLDYHDDVPAGGVHSSVWLNCGIYREPVHEENAVHSLEHGAIWLAYRPDLPAEQVKILRNLVRQERGRRGEPMIILSPRENLDAPLVATAWRVQLNLDDATDQRLEQFVRRYQRGPFTPEPGALCWDGVGEPLG